MNSIEVLKKSLETSFESDYILIIISLFFCILSSFILSYVYKNKSNSLSSKVQLSTIIPLLANITFLVILIVKSSLALSLGLVGALSVIRFRTPVKEPEDLVFLFFAIALGIGYGALQILPTSIIFVILITLIWFYLSSRKEIITNDFNVIVECNLVNNQELFDTILELLKKNCTEVNFVKLEQETNNSILYYKASFENDRYIKDLINSFNKDLKDIKFSIYENKIIE